MSDETTRETIVKRRLPHIGLNAQLLSLAPNYRSAGINRYIYNVLLQLSRYEKDHRFTAFLSERNLPALGDMSRRVSRLPTSRPPVRIFWEQIVQPWLLWKEGIDLLHSLAFVVPVWASCPSVVTVYDLTFLRYPETFRRGNRLYLSQFVRLSAARASHFIAISESTASDIRELLGVEAKRISVVHCGVDPDYQPLPVKAVEAFRVEKALPGRLILYLGTIEPRKNLATLIRAYHRLREAWPGSVQGGELPHLVIAGGKGWDWQQIFALVERLELQQHVMFPGFVPDHELPMWYNVAECFAYPSRYEGFGLPVLEAMACGTPVITSNTSSLPEVVGEAGLTVSPDDVEGWATALRQGLTDNDLRDRLRQHGLQRAARFSWEDTARQTVAVYDRVLASGG